MNPSLYSCFSSLSAWCPITSFLIPPAPLPDERWPTSVRQNRPAEVKVSRPSVRTNSGLKLYLWPTPAAGTSVSLQRHRPHSVPSSSPGCWPVVGPASASPSFLLAFASERPNMPSLDPPFMLMLLVISFSLTALGSSPILMTPQFLSPFLASPLNFRLMYPTAYSTSALGCQIDVLSLTC